MKKTSLFLVSATALVLLAASSSARAETAPSPLAPPPHMVPSAMTGHQAPLARALRDLHELLPGSGHSVRAVS